MSHETFSQCVQQWLSDFHHFSESMMPLRISSVCLLWLYLTSSEDTVWQLSRPSITHLQALSDRQSLLVSWQLNHSDLLGDVYEIQIGRSLNHTIIYNRNISVASIDSHQYTWTSDLPLECVDHSVRIRMFYNESVLSPWSSWKTNHGAQAKDQAQIFPFQRVLREGTSAMFCCVPPLGVNITSISINNRPYPLINISDKVKAITVEKLTMPSSIIDTLSIICSDDAGHNRHIFNDLSSPPQKPKNLSCVTSDMKYVTCTWDSDREQELDNRNDKTHTLHIRNSDKPPILCEQLSCTFPAIPHLEEYNIRVEVENLLGKETESYSFNISDRVFPVVARCSVSPGITDTTVSWFMLWDLPKVSLLCQVTTVPGNTTVMTCNSVGGSCKVILEHLQPNTHYTTRVRCSADGRLWGKWTPPVTFKTYSLVTLDVWRRITQLPDQNSRQVTLMWTPNSAATVTIQGYKVQWSQGGKKQTVLKNNGQTQAEVSIGPGQCDFTVQAVVHTGSTVPAQITVPQKDDQEKNTPEKQLSSSSAAGFNLSWEQDETTTCGYTVDWCLLGNVVPCTLRWVKMSEGNNTLFLPGRHFKAGCRYTFSIFGCWENGHRLLEMQTGYLQELNSVPSPSLVELVQSTSSSVMLEWFYSEDDASHSAFITGYLITVQEPGSVTLSGHVSDLVNVLVSDPHRKSVTIDGLQQNQEYTFSVSALTKEGPGQAASITVRTKTNYSALVVKILTPFFLLLGCAVLLWPQRKTLQRGLMGIIFYPAGMNIKTPELDRSLQETSEWLQSQKPEEVQSCDIEILTNRPLLNHSPLRDPEALNTLPPPGPQSSPLTLQPPCVPLQTEYFPQLWNTAPLRQTTHITNRTYFNTMEYDLCKTQRVMFSDVK